MADFLIFLIIELRGVLYKKRIEIRKVDQFGIFWNRAWCTIFCGTSGNKVFIEMTLFNTFTPPQLSTWFMNVPQG